MLGVESQWAPVAVRCVVRELAFNNLMQYVAYFLISECALCLDRK